MAEEQDVFLPVGPYKQYEKLGAIPEPKPGEEYVDSTTGVHYGRYSEQEILDDIAHTAATQVQFKLDPDAAYNNRLAVDSLLEGSAEGKGFHTDIKTILGTKFDIGYKSAKVNSLWAKFIDNDDPAIMSEIDALESDIGKLSMEIPPDLNDRSILLDIGASAFQQIGQMKKGFEEGSAMMTATTLVGGIVGSIIEPGVGTVAGLKAGMAAGGAGAMGKFSIEQEVAEIFKSAYRFEDEKTGSRISPSIAREVAKEYGLIAGLIDTVGMAGMLKAARIPETLIARVKGVGGEEATEWAQTLLEEAALRRAKSLMTERTGMEFTEVPFTEDLSKARQAARAGALTAIGFAGPGAAVHTVKSSHQAIQAVRQFEIAKEAERELANTEAQAAERKAVLEDVKGKPTIPTKNDVTGQVQEAAPLQPEELQEASESVRVRGTKIDDNTLSDLAVASDVETIEELSTRIAMQVTESSSPEYANFITELHSILPREEAQVIEDLIDARASALGLSGSEYITRRGLSLTAEEGSEGGPAATVQLMDDGRAIITAFRSADVSSLVHEIGHVFRQEIAPEERQILDEWLGIEQGAEWGVAEEEKFARAFERHFIDGKAPSKSLQRVFSRLSTWLTNIYKTLAGSEIDIEFSPQVREVFNRMLTEQRNARQEFLVSNQKNTILEQRQKGQTGSSKSAVVQNTVIDPIDLDSMNDISVLKAEIKVYQQKMQNALDSAENRSYEAAKTELKAVLTRAAERARFQRAHKSVKDKLVSTVKKAAKTGKGKYSYDVNLVFSDLNERLGKLGKISEIKAEYARILSENGDFSNMETADALYNHIVEALVRRNQYGLKSLRDIYKAIKDLAKKGRSESPLVKNLLASKRLAEAAIPEILGSTVDLEAAKRGEIQVGPSVEEASRQRKKAKTLRERFRTMTLGKNAVLGIEDLLDVVSSYSKSAFGDTVLGKAFNFFENRQQQLTDVRESTKLLHMAYMKAFEVKTAIAMYNRIKKQSTPNIDVGHPVLFSMSQVRQVWMYMQDESLRTRLLNSGIDKAVRDNINEIMANSPQDTKFARSLLNMFQSNTEYQRNNAVYRVIFGVDMPRYDNYVPIRSEAVDAAGRGAKEDQKAISQIQSDTILRAGTVTAKSIRDRVKRAEKSPLRIQGDVSLFQEYQEEMAHFRAYAEKTRLARSVLSSKRIRDAIVLEYGATTYGKIMDALEAITIDGSVHSQTMSEVDRFVQALTLSDIGLSAGVSIKQMISVVNYWQKMPLLPLIRGLMKFWMNPIRNYKEISGLDYIKNRKFGLDREFKSAITSAEYRSWRLNPAIQNFFGLSVRLSDAAAIALGGWAYVEYLVDQGHTRSEALKIMAMESDRTQQSGVMEQRSWVQRQKFITPLFTRYSSGPIQAIRQELNAIRLTAAGRMDKKTAAKTLFIYHVLVPAMYSIAGSFIAGDDMDEAEDSLKMALALGPFGSAYAVGRLTMNTMREVFGMKSYRNSGPFTDSVQEVSRIAKAAVKDGGVDLSDLTLDDWSRAIEAVLVIRGVGVPLNRTTRMLENAVDGDIIGTIFGTNPNKDED